MAEIKEEVAEVMAGVWKCPVTFAKHHMHADRRVAELEHFIVDAALVGRLRLSPEWRHRYDELMADSFSLSLTDKDEAAAALSSLERKD